MTTDPAKFGVGDASFKAAGGERGIRALVDTFYDLMEADPRFRTIWEMHPPDRTMSRDKLAVFLCGWLGGPRNYQAKYGSLNIPRAHQHLTVGLPERDQWLSCMAQAIDECIDDKAFRTYLVEQLSVPANAIVKRSQAMADSAAESDQL
ncbi:MAG: group II truncated hemoglobin [Pseudomonadota bacterium]